MLLAQHVDNVLLTAEHLNDTEMGQTPKTHTH